MWRLDVSIEGMEMLHTFPMTRPIPIASCRVGEHNEYKRFGGPAYLEWGNPQSARKGVSTQLRDEENVGDPHVCKCSKPIQFRGVGRDHRGDLSSIVLDTSFTRHTKGFSEDGTYKLGEIVLEKIVWEGRKDALRNESRDRPSLTLSSGHQQWKLGAGWGALTVHRAVSKLSKGDLVDKANCMNYTGYSPSSMFLKNQI